MNKNFQLFFSLLIVFLFSACTHTVKPTHQTSIATDSLNIKHRELSAIAFYDTHDYAAALTQWEILRTIKPNKTEYKNRIRVISALIKRRAKINLNQGKEALKRKDYVHAETAFLKVLAKNPKHQEALSLLKSIEENRIENKQQAKTRRLKKKQLAKFSKNNQFIPQHLDNSQDRLFLEMGLSLYKKGDWSGSIREIEKYLSVNEHDQKARNTVAKSHFKLSGIYESRGHLEPAIQHLEDGMKNSKVISETQQDKLQLLKEHLSESFYSNGLKSYRNDIGQAIAYWQRAINYNPNHFKAQNRLRKAEQIQKNLKIIKQ